MKEKTDRRVMYTKMMLKDALIELMQTQHISSISVKSLCEMADINRSTFYAHFNDPHDLLRNIGQEVLTNMKKYLESQEILVSRPISAQVLTRILEYAKENAALFKVLLSENSDFAFHKEIMQLSQIFTSQLSHSFDKRTQVYLQVFGVTGCISVLHKWLQDGTVESPSEMTELIMQILYHGITGIQNC